MMRESKTVVILAMGAALTLLLAGAQAAAAPAAPVAEQARFAERNGAPETPGIVDAGREGPRASFLFMARNGGHGAGRGFVDEDGDGINDLAPDHDGDGVPNCQDADYTKRPRDGTGNQHGHRGSGGGGRGNGSGGGRGGR